MYCILFNKLFIFTFITLDPFLIFAYVLLHAHFSFIDRLRLIAVVGDGGFGHHNRDRDPERRLVHLSVEEPQPPVDRAFVLGQERSDQVSVHEFRSTEPEPQENG